MTQIITAHAMRNAAMQKAGLMPVVCPIGAADGTAGICVFGLSLGDAARVMDGDPAVQAGVLAYDLYPSFTLPT